MAALFEHWIRYFGPPEFLIHDQESGLMGDIAGLACDRFHIRRKIGGTDAHTPQGLAERHIGLTKAIALKTHADVAREGTPAKAQK